jgi:hypothetical protein
MLGYLADERLAVVIRHPVARLYSNVVINLLVKVLL